MKYKQKELPHSQVEIEVTLSGDDFRKYWDIAYEKARLEVGVKGFRPGTAPKEITDPLIDKEKVFNEATKASVRDSLRDVAEDNEWQVIDQPKIDVREADPQKGLKFKTVLTLFPKVSLADYKKIAHAVTEELSQPVEKIVISDEEVQKSLDWLRSSRAAEIAVARGIYEGDLVEVDIKSEQNGKLVEGAQLDRDRFIVGKSNFIPGFDKELLTHKQGETFRFSLIAPEKYWNEKMRGQNIDFTVTVRSVFERKLPELNDEFVRNLNPNFKKVDDLKKSIREGLRLEKQKHEREKIRIKIIENIVADSKADLPEIMVARTLDGMVEEFRPMLKKTGKNEDDIRKDLEIRARQNVMSNLVIHAIAKQEHLEPTAAEVEDEKKITPPELLRGVDDRAANDYIYGVLVNRKIHNFLESLNEKSNEKPAS